MTITNNATLLDLSSQVQVEQVSLAEIYGRIIKETIWSN